MFSLTYCGLSVQIVQTPSWVESSNKCTMVTTHLSASPNPFVGKQTNVTQAHVYPSTCLTRTPVYLNKKPWKRVTRANWCASIEQLLESKNYFEKVFGVTSLDLEDSAALQVVSKCPQGP